MNNAIRLGMNQSVSVNRVKKFRNLLSMIGVCEGDSYDIDAILRPESHRAARDVLLVLINAPRRA
ncbi:MAG: hypothetical protein ABIW79_08960, partial [Gemmatimonas sp.]